MNGVKDKVMAYNREVSEFELESNYYVHFQTAWERYVRSNGLRNISDIFLH